MTAKAIYERLVLVPGPQQFVLFVTMPYAPTTLQLALQLILDLQVYFGLCITRPLNF